MLPAATDRRPTLPTISVTRPPVVSYWTGYAPAIAGGAELDNLLSPLDGHLLHLFLEVSAGGVTVVDLAAETTAGTSTIAALSRANTRVYAVAGQTSDPGSVAAALMAYKQEHAGQSTAFETISENDPPAVATAPAGLIVLVDARAGNVAATIERWLTARPEAVILILGVGLVGASESLEAILQTCGSSSGRRLWLARELAESLAASRLAIVSLAGRTAAATAVTRVAGLFSGNVSFVDLLWGMNRQAISSAGADRMALEQHGNAAPLIHELNTLKRQMARLNSEASLEKLAELTSMVHDRDQHIREIQSSFGYRLLGRTKRLRRLVAPDNGVIHRTWLYWRRNGTIALLRRPFGYKPKPAI